MLQYQYLLIIFRYAFLLLFGILRPIILKYNIIKENENQNISNQKQSISPEKYTYQNTWKAKSPNKEGVIRFL
jgi:hypothetical protein